MSVPLTAADNAFCVDTLEAVNEEQTTLCFFTALMRYLRVHRASVLGVLVLSKKCARPSKRLHLSGKRKVTVFCLSQTTLHLWFPNCTYHLESKLAKCLGFGSEVTC